MGIRTRRARRHSRTHFVGFGIAGLLGFIVLLTLALAFSLGTIVDNWLKDLPDFESDDAYLVSEPTTVFDSKGNVIAEYYAENRRAVTLDEISPYVVKGTVDTEDIRFYQHNGVDPQGIARAVVVTLLGGSEGASTIDQQLVRNTVLSDEQFDKTLRRKVREAYIATEMEKKYSKDQILNMYLNTIYYGSGAYGIEAAAKTYFNKDAKDLTLAESALLVGIPNSPSLYDPTVNPDASVQRRNLVLNRMLTAGDIDQAEYDQAVNTPLELNRGSNVMDSTGTYPYWTQYIKNLLSEDFSSDTVLKGGLKVYTTLDPGAQSAAETAVTDQLNAIGQDGLNAALVAIDPSTGYIKAMVGGRDYNALQMNLAVDAARQPGSSFKMFTLVAALSQGMNPNVQIDCNSPLRVSSNWIVKNYGGASYGTLTLQQATMRSSNTGYVQVAEAVGPANIVKTAKSMGITADLPAYDSITLGTIGVPVVQMAEAYSVLAAGGVHRNAVAITKIEDRNGNTVYEHKDNPQQVIDAKVAYAATQVLETVINGGRGATASVLQNYGINQPMAGKTGTTEYADNLWFCGYTPQIAVAVWTGYPESSKEVYVNGSSGHPSNTSCPMWANFVKSYLGDTARAEFTDPGEPDYVPNSKWDFAVNAYSRRTSDDDTNSSSSSNSSDTDSPNADNEAPAVPTDNTGTGATTGGGGTSGGGTSDAGNPGGTGGSSGGDGPSDGGGTGGGETGGGETGGGTGGDAGGGAETGGDGETPPSTP